MYGGLNIQAGVEVRGGRERERDLLQGQDLPLQCPADTQGLTTFHPGL